MAIDLGDSPVAPSPNSLQIQQLKSILEIDNIITSDTTAAGTGSQQIINMVAITQVDYDTLDSENSLDGNTLYLITG